MPQKMTSVCLAALLAAGCLLPGCQCSRRPGDSQGPVSSTELAETGIVPTLDTPLPKSGNAVWCATFQVAWNRACDDVVGEPLRISGAQPVADRLNSSPVTEAVLPPGSYYAVSGRHADGIVATIQQEMARRFPGVQLPDFEGELGFVAYAYLDTKAEFTTPFVDTEEPIEFRDAAGVAHSVSGFGLHEGPDQELRSKQRRQVKVLFVQTGEVSGRSVCTAFALDLTADQPEQQVIVAVLPRPEHLRAALDELARRIDQFPPEKYAHWLRSTDSLAIPNVRFYVEHEFEELQGEDKIIENPGEPPGSFVEQARESIRFRLDKSGAAVISEAVLEATGSVLPEPREFIVDRPFLVVMKRRSADEPYFVAWIESVELLEVK